MKKLITILAAIILTAGVFAQAPQKMSYQAVIRNAGNTLITNSAIGMRVSILQGSASGTVVYEETQTPTTNANGLATIEIGGGTVVSGNINTIDWAVGPYYIKTETDPDGGTNYTIVGTSQLMSVPFALYAQNSGNSTAGPQGPQGPIGATGPQGQQGAVGATGAQGATGATGPQGPIGLTGATGAQGLQGADGATGATGPQGPIGLTGAAGAQGLQGDTGATGAQGPQGDTGATGLLTPGSTAGVTPYWNGNAWVVNSANIYNNGGSIGIGTTSPNPSAILDLTSTTQLFYPPRMTQAQRDAISSPSSGATLFNTTDNKTETYVAAVPTSTDGTGSDGTWAQWDGPAQGQTIQPLSTGILKSIEAQVAIRVSTGNIQVKVYNSVNGSLIATSDSTVTAPWIGSEFNFVVGMWTFNNANLTLNSGTTYYFEFTATNGNHFFIGSSTNYTRGNIYTGNTGSVVEQPGYDIDCIILYGGSPAQWIASSQGPAGPQGAQGVQGDTGVAGLQGIQGIQGNTGATGASGPQGSQGIQGDTGVAGPQGIQGIQGNTGATGPQGIQGIQGTQGVKGDTGATGFLQPGATAGNTPYWNGSAWVTNNSNIYNNGSNVGIGTDTPNAPLDINGNAIVEGNVLASKYIVPGGTNAQFLKADGSLDNSTYLTVAEQGVSFLNPIDTNPNVNGATLVGIGMELEPASANYGGVVTTGTQSFAGTKTFTGSVGIGTNTPAYPLDVNGSAHVATDMHIDNDATIDGNLTEWGNSDFYHAVTLHGGVTSTAYFVTGGTSSQFLKADGSLDTTTYLTTTQQGVTTVASIDTNPNVNGAVVNGTTLNLEPASATYGGVVTTGAQTFAGTKTFTGSVGIGTNTPAYPLDVNGSAHVATDMHIDNDAIIDGNLTEWGNSDFYHAVNMHGSFTTLNTANFTEGATSTAYVVTGGTSSQFLKGDGSLDNTGYATAASLSTVMTALTVDNVDLTNVTTSLALKANIASPTFTGTPAAPTPSTGDSSSTIATTAFVTAAIDAVSANAISVGAIAGSSSANGASITSGVLNLTPADATNGGVVTNSTQTFAGNKSFNNDISVNSTMIGRGAGSNTSSRNIAIGNSSMVNNNDGEWNTAIGTYALQENVSAWANTAVGNEALSNAIPGNNNTGLGSRALFNTTGAGNIAAGTNAAINNTSGSSNVAIGFNTLGTNKEGSNITVLGEGADVSADSLSNATAIGSGAIVNASNTMQLGNTSVTNVYTSGLITANGFQGDGSQLTNITVANGSITSAKLASSVALAGTPTAPTPSAGDNSTAIATTAFVNNAVSLKTVADAESLPSFALTDGNSGNIITTQWAALPNFPDNLPDGFTCDIVNYSNYPWSSNTLGTAIFVTATSSNAGETSISMVSGGTAHVSVVTIGGQKTYFVSGDAY